MNTKSVEPSLSVGQEKLLAFVRAMIGTSQGREDDEHPLPPGPWDPVIRIALEKINVFGPRPEPWRQLGPGHRHHVHGVPAFGPHPEPWKAILASVLDKHPEIFDAIVGGHSFGDEVSLNPQPLPPRYAFLLAVAQTVTRRAELLQDIADATARKGEQQGIIIVSGYVNRFTDEFCGNDLRLRWPFPGPRPQWFAHELTGIDLVVLATQFDTAAAQSFSPDLRRGLSQASARLAEAGMARMR